MAFAQLTYRESLRDVEACLRAQRSKLYHMGFSGPVSRSTLADANETRDWRIHADFAHALITIACKLYAGDDFGVELSQTVYAFDATTIDLCLTVFPWARFQTIKSAIKLHTLLDLRGNIPSFLHNTDGQGSDYASLDVLPLEAGSFYIMDRGYIDFARLDRFKIFSDLTLISPTFTDDYDDYDDYKVISLITLSVPLSHVVFVIGSRLLLGVRGNSGCFSGVWRFLAGKPRGVKRYFPILHI